MLVEQSVAHTLSHAADYTYNQATARTLAAQRAKILQTAHNLLLRIITYRACVE